MANTLRLYRNGAVGFIDWLDLLASEKLAYVISFPVTENVQVRAEQKETSNHQNAAANEEPLRRRYPKCADENGHDANDGDCDADSSPRGRDVNVLGRWMGNNGSIRCRSGVRCHGSNETELSHRWRERVRQT